MDTLDFPDLSPIDDSDAIDLNLIMPELPPPTTEDFMLLMKLMLSAKSNPKPLRISRKDSSPYSEKISIRIPHYQLAVLKDQSKALGMGYQTHINRILAEHTAIRPTLGNLSQIDLNS